MHFKATLQIIACDLSVVWFSSAPANCEQSVFIYEILHATGKVAV